MAHGDQRGLRLPPKVAPIQVVIIPIAAHKGGVLEKAAEIKDTLTKAGIRVFIDDTEQSTGWKFNQWEMKGVPVRLEIGPRDIENGQVMLARRDTHEKFAMPIAELATGIPALLNNITETMFKQSSEHLYANIVRCSNMDEFKAAVDNGKFVETMWCGDEECENKIKELTAASSRVMPFDQTPCGDKCVYCGRKGIKRIYFAKAY